MKNKKCVHCVNAAVEDTVLCRNCLDRFNKVMDFAIKNGGLSGDPEKTRKFFEELATEISVTELGQMVFF